MKKYEKVILTTKKFLTGIYFHTPGRKNGTVKVAGIKMEFWIHAHTAHQARNGDTVKIQTQKKSFL